MSEFVIWGRNPIIEALRAGREVEKIYVAHDSHPPRELMKLAKERGIKLQKVSRQKVEELAGTKKTQGVIALLSPVSYVNPRELFSETFKRSSFFVVIDHITDPQNVGNLLRTCEVLGGVGALLSKEKTTPVNQTVIKASSGAVFHLKLSKVSSLHRALREFKDMGGWVFSIEKGGKDIRDLQIVLPCALVLGSEDKGVSKSVLDISDEVLTIPMRGRTTSLNVGAAGAIAMWEAVRRVI
ncbi:23S rRNA (guanosine2251-2'-O)-methyltransferase [Hydrogenivirga caldilitoris]|uniref:23S rRNA (Guanosine2251-2'-O)-methyltransferase n=1 Tax=Hydrogenivirga caldilitoris TaxID=246264 RepID=A0A497XPK7_9AQUI|nr:23S rRNA (guanosine(2251)-2'-O)-methyltransferase RlmB [Hydrogenivirga caldilitoris]RLJ70049.1 23S rRNA (guanosine2251-2'-O)-methyltransferase [Hydrogenivirga caldilitoris]